MTAKKLYDRALKGDASALRTIVPIDSDFERILREINTENNTRRSDIYHYGTKVRILDNDNIPVNKDVITGKDWPTTRGRYSPNDYKPSERVLDLGEYLSTTSPLKIDSRPHTAPHRPMPGNVVRVNLPGHRYHGKFGVVISDRPSTGEICIRIKHVAVDMFIKYKNVTIWEK